MTNEQEPEDQAYGQKLRTHEQNQRLAERAHENNTDFFQRTNESAVKNTESAVKAAMVINGGAAVSLLAFIGGLAAQGKVQVSQLVSFANCLMWFVSGVALAGAMAGLTYFTNYCIAGQAISVSRIWEAPYLIDSPQSRKWKCLASGVLSIRNDSGGDFLFDHLCVRNVQRQERDIAFGLGALGESCGTFLVPTPPGASRRAARVTPSL